MAQHRTINLAGLNLIKTDEGLRLKAYRDGAGVWTDGYGHTGPEVGPTSVVTPDQATANLSNDIARFEIAVDHLTADVPTTDNQFAAMVSFAFNEGAGALAGSTLLREHRVGNYPAAAQAFLLWNKMHDPVTHQLVHCNGLDKRRRDEVALYGSI